MIRHCKWRKHSGINRELIRIISNIMQSCYEHQRKLINNEQVRASVWESDLTLLTQSSIKKSNCSGKRDGNISQMESQIATDESDKTTSRQHVNSEMQKLKTLSINVESNIPQVSS